MSRVLLICTFLAALQARAEQLTFAPFDEQNEQTKEVIRRVVTAYGGESALRRIGAVKRSAEIHSRIAGELRKIEYLGLYFFPESLFLKVRSPKGDSTAIADGPAGHVYKADSPVQGAAMKMNGEELQQFYQFVYEDPLMVLQNKISPSVLFALGGSSKFGNYEVDVLNVQVRAVDMQWYVDRATGRILRNVIGNTAHDFDDWRTTAGLTLPFVQKNIRDGKVFEEIVYKDFEINPSINRQSLFKTPTLWLSRYPYPGRGDSVSQSYVFYIFYY